MNPLLFISVVPMAVLGAVLIASGSAGWGIALLGAAIALSQTAFLLDVWAEYKRQLPTARSLLAALATCMRRSA